MSNTNVVKVFFATAVVGLIGLICILLIICGAATPFVQCFSVDQQERIYVGLNGKIEVYEHGKCIESFSPQTSRAYVFTILEDDSILLSTPSMVYSMDLHGNVLDSWKEDGTDTFNQLQYKRNRFTSLDGSQFRLKGNLGWTRIIKNNTDVVYRIPVFSFAVKLILYLWAISLIALVVYVLKHNKI